MLIEDDSPRVQAQECPVRRLADALPEVVILYDLKERRFVFGNEQALRLFGVTFAEFILLDPRSVAHPGDAENFRALLECPQGAAGGAASEHEVRVKNNRGEWRWLSCRCVIHLRDTDGRPREVCCTARDVTGYKLAEAALRERANLLDDSTDAIAVLNMRNEVTFWNRGAENLYGWAFDEAHGRRLVDLLHRGLPARLKEAEQTLFERGKWRGELTQVTKDGAEVVVESRWTLIRDEQGDPKSVFVVNTDITAKKRFEALVLRAQRMESIGAMASALAHDLNNVLAPILIGLHTLKQRHTDENSRRWLSLMSRSVERGKDLIERILAFARGVEGERAPLCVAGLIRDVARILKDTLPKNIELQVQTPEDLWSVIGDATQIHQVLMNLCINARDAMPGGGKLMISARNRRLVEEERLLGAKPLQKQYVRITVADTGVGISEEIIDRIFDPFFTTKDKGKGSGLGLSTALAIVRGHGGFVNLLSRAGKGTEFKVYLPAHEAGAMESDSSDTDRTIPPPA